MAQSVPPLPVPPPSVPPPLPTREQLRPSQILDQRDRIRREQNVTKPLVDQAPCPLQNSEYKEIRFTLRDVIFQRQQGAEAIDIASLRHSWEGYIDQEIPVAQICRIRDQAAAKLREQGYLAAILVPEQTIAEGVIRFDIISARISRIQIYGNVGASSGIVARYLEPLQQQKIFNSRQAERYLLLVREIPGLDARLTLRPSDTAGELIGNVTVQRTRFVLDRSSHNFGTRAVGRRASVIRLRANGLTGLGDQSHVAFYATGDFREQLAFEVGHEMRLGSQGLRVGGRYSQARTRPGIAGRPLTAYTKYGNFYFGYPLVLRQDRQIRINGGLDIINQDTFFNDILFGQDRLRITNLQLDMLIRDDKSIIGRGGYSAAEPRWQISASIAARKGIAFLGASTACDRRNCFAVGAAPLSRADANPQAFLLRGRGNAIFRPTPNLYFSLAMRGQWAASPLPSYEEFSVSNFTIGRGYDPGSVVADSGIAATLEIGYGALSASGRGALTLGQFAFQPYVFYDGARVWYKNTTPPTPTYQQAHAVGGGLRVVWKNRTRIEFAVAFPLQATPLQPNTGGARFLLTTSGQFGFGRR